MKTKVFTCALLLASLAISAQTNEKKQATVRIKKVENINGVETITDTTFTTDDPSAIKLDEGSNIQTINISGNGEDGKIVIVNDETVNGENSNVKIIRKGEGALSEEEIQKIMKEAEQEMKKAEIQMIHSEKDMKVAEQSRKDAELALEKLEVELRNMDKSSDGKKGVKKVIIINDEESKGNGKSEKRMTKVIMLKMDITDASAEDVKRLGAGSVDNKVEMDNMKLYPNPNDGKFNLNFNLKNKADAEVTVYDLQGKQVYNEKLPNFTGEYNKPIDISSNAKGIYFVKIQQGKHTQVKKISLD